MVQIVNLKKSFGARVLFAEINLKLDAGKRYGLIGANGALGVVAAQPVKVASSALLLIGGS